MYDKKIEKTFLSYNTIRFLVASHGRHKTCLDYMGPTSDFYLKSMEVIY